MVDTVKLLLDIHDPLHLDGSRFSPISIEQLVKSRGGFGRTYLNPLPIYVKMGRYMPSLTMFKRATKSGVPTYQLAIEFSAPKVVYCNNFDELQESDFEVVLTNLQSALQELLGYTFSIAQLAQADVSAWHPSKNVVFLTYTSCLTILNTISKLDVSKRYDLQKTDYRDGHVVHIHANSLDIAFYDKMADLRKAKISSKRAFEKDSLVQLGLLEDLMEYRPMEVFRYEVRLVGRASVKRSYPELERWTFEELFKKKLCQDVLLKHWNKITSSADMLALDVKEPLELLQNYLAANPTVPPQAALSAAMGLLVASQAGVSSLRNVLEAHYGKQAWYRLKPSLKPPQADRFQAFVHIDKALQQFTPTRMSDYIRSIENSVK